MDKEKSKLEKRLNARMKKGGILDTTTEEKKLDPSLRREFTLITGKDTGDVRIHSGPQAAKLTQTMNARALAFGSGDIYFAPGQFSPQTAEGKSLLAHEMTHVSEGIPGASGVPLYDQRKEGEIRAQMVEKMVLARERFREQEKRSPQEPEKIQMEKAGPDKDDSPMDVTIDKAALEEKTYEILQKMMRLEQERNGRF